MIKKRIINGKLVDLSALIPEGWVKAFREAECSVCHETVQEHFERCLYCGSPIDALMFPPEEPSPGTPTN
jgi:hypothetical protein